MSARGGGPATDPRCGHCPLPAVCETGPDAGLPGALLDSVTEQRKLAPGAMLYRAGEKRCSLWVIAAGALKTCELDIEGREQVVGFHGAGDVLGLERLEIPAHRGFALALQPSQVCRIPVNRLVEQLSRRPDLWRAVLGIAGQQISRAREVHRVLGQMQTGQRLAWFLLHSSGLRRDPCACACSHQQEVHLPMQRQDIASFLGMTLETVSRSFSALQRAGLIEVHGRAIRLLDAAGLAARITPLEHAAA